jgi:hypothetical protein
MRINRTLLSAAAAALAFAGLAYAQSVPVPQVPIINPTDLIQVVPLGQPSAQSKYATPAQITSQLGYAKYSPLTAFSYTFANSQSDIVLTHSTTIAQGTITFAAAPSDGARECVFAQNTVTTLNLAANTGQTLNNAVTTIAAAARVCYLYSISNLTWDRD